MFAKLRGGGAAVCVHAEHFGGRLGQHFACADCTAGLQALHSSVHQLMIRQMSTSLLAGQCTCICLGALVCLGEAQVGHGWTGGNMRQQLQ